MRVSHDAVLAQSCFPMKSACLTTSMQQMPVGGAGKVDLIVYESCLTLSHVRTKVTGSMTHSVYQCLSVCRRLGGKLAGYSNSEAQVQGMVCLSVAQTTMALQYNRSLS